MSLRNAASHFIQKVVEQVALAERMDCCFGEEAICPVRLVCLCL